MDFNFLLIGVIYSLVVVVILFVIKALYQTVYITKMGKINYQVLEEYVSQGERKLEKTRLKLLLVEDLHKTLFNRLFKITRDIILMQKLIFEIHTTK